MQASLFAGEVMKRAQMLIKSRGQDALDHANLVFESMQESGDEDAIFYWHRIVRQVELLVDEVKEYDPG